MNVNLLNKYFDFIIETNVKRIQLMGVCNASTLNFHFHRKELNTKRLKTIK